MRRRMRAAGSAGDVALDFAAFAFVALGGCFFAGFAAVTFVAITTPRTSICSFPGDLRRRGNPFSHAFTMARARSFPGDLSRRRGSGVVGILVDVSTPRSRRLARSADFVSRRAI